uniref:Disease resistance N-terminal domain-containing protein n=1 Tax=Opuntia streptacantha TaxID=393608 RepID=A0A7C8ZH64_OPUST
MAAITSTQREIEMAAAVLFSIAEDILKNLRSRALNKIASAWGFKSQLEKLKNTVTTIKYVLQDVEERQLQSQAICLWLERLKQVVYAADDLFDEFATTASRREIMGGSKLTKEVKTFFSHSNQIAFAFNISHKAKKIREEVDDILRDGLQFAFLVQSCGERSVARRSETYSFVDAQLVIGRDDDKKAILGILDQYQDQRVCVVCIVGMGGQVWGRLLWLN